ncbi:MAG: excinuclease ABC subunit C [Bacteroidetes bacterium]|nr:excinuclease ABC subunit C [Bacteroidota bacterium]MBS1741064.1 excinuclease ABC subunit C [Bacteroidota bacterium]
MNKAEFQDIAQSLPHAPGCYKYFNAQNELLYVGKAKDLRKRVSSYFNKTVDNYKTRRLVSLIHHIEFTVTDNEHDAFLLENSLIKHFQPRFNIDLKDDKSYPYIVIKKEPFPRVFITRSVIRDGSEYIGPFTSVARVRELLQIIRNNIPLRTCNLSLTPANIAKGKFKVCLEYHLGNCKGPCEGLQTEADYAQGLQQARHILKGNTGEVIRYLKKEMMGFAAEMKFEKAEILRQKIESLLQYQSKSTVVNTHLGNADVASILSDDDVAFVNFMIVSNGSIISANTVQIEKHANESDEEILSIAVARLHDRFQSTATEIIVPMNVQVTDTNFKITIPKSGDKKKLLDMSLRNAQIFREDLRRKKSLLLKEKTDEDYKKILESLQKALHLSSLPIHIECFDNSNFQGAFPVAAMVCFKNGQPDKKNYRHFHIKTVEGINDFASMSEIVYRRYKRLLDENAPLPQLVIIDGGKGQLGAALSSIQQLNLLGKMTLIGLAKREESIFFPGDKEPLQLPFDHPAHLLIRRIRDEVHRFGITFHRQTRSKGTIKNELESIPGIGEKTASELLKIFRSINNIKQLTERELTRVAGASKARIIFHFFHPDK